VQWQRVEAVDVHRGSTFTDGSPAVSVRARLDDRTVEFLFPSSMVSDDQLRAIAEIAMSNGSPASLAMETPPESASTSAAAPTAGSKATYGPPTSALPPPPPSTRGADEGMRPGPAETPTAQVGLTEASGTVEGSRIIPSAPPLPRLTPREVTARVERTRLTPLAVPSARRAENQGGDQIDADLAGARQSSVRPNLPPPPPGRGVSALPSAPAITPQAPPIHAAQQVAPAEAAVRSVAAPLVAPEPPRAIEVEQSVLPPPPATLPPPPPQEPATRPSYDEWVATRSETGPRPAATGPHGQPAGLHEQVAPVPTRQRTRRRSPRLTRLGAWLVLVVAVIGGAVFGLAITDHGGNSASGNNSTTPPGVATRGASGGSPKDAKTTTPQPPSLVVAGVMSRGVNLTTADLPTGWAPGAQPWVWSATAQADRSLAGCLGVPVGHLGVLTGNTEPGGPTVSDSGWVDSPTAPETGFKTYVVPIEQPTQAYDLSALSSGGAATCLRGWFASLGQSGDQIVSAPDVVTMPVHGLSGQRTAGFKVSLVTRTSQGQVGLDEDIVVLGEGRVETALVSESLGSPVATSVENAQLNGIEHRLASVAND
jgi:hypothetical protein